MDCHQLLEQAVGYLEDHLTEDMDCAAVAKQCYVSSYHFQRVFSLLCGMPLGEYIRKRRLTLAGLELADRPEIQLIHTDHAEVWLPIEPI